MKEERLINLPKEIRRRRIKMFRVGDGVEFRYQGAWFRGYIVEKMGGMFKVGHPDGAQWTVDVDDVSHKVGVVGWSGLFDNSREMIKEGRVQEVERWINVLNSMKKYTNDHQQSMINDLIRPLAGGIDAEIGDRQGSGKCKQP